MSNGRITSTTTDQLAALLQTCPTLARDCISAGLVNDRGGAAPLAIAATSQTAGAWLVQWTGTPGDHSVSTDGSASVDTFTDYDGQSFALVRNVADGETISVSNAGTVTITAGVDLDAQIVRGRDDDAVAAPCVVLSFPIVARDKLNTGEYDTTTTMPAMYMSPRNQGTDAADDLRIASDNSDGLVDYIDTTIGLLDADLVSTETASPLAIETTAPSRGGQLVTAITLTFETVQA